MKHTFGKRLGALGLCLCLMLSLLPGTALAAGEITTISTVAELKAFRDSVNGGTAYQGITVTLTTDLDLGGNESDQWTPIGTPEKPFTGTFDGGHHKITGLYCATSW